MTGRLKDKVAVVFGAGSVGEGWGNGKAAAVLYAREGARVVAADINPEAAEQTATIIRDEGGVAGAMTANVTDAAEIATVVEETLSRHGRIDVLHNNVGINMPGGIADASEESWDRVMDTNAKGIFLTCKAVIPAMAEQGRGAIVNVSSLASIRWTGYPYISYYASKAAVNNMTLAMAMEYADKGIRANCILPGVMDTPHIYQQISGYYNDIDEMVRQRNAIAPMKRMGDAWDVAYAALFLASDESKYITGISLCVDGGLHCKTY